LDKNLKNIIVIGGGTGTFTILSALKNHPVNLSAIVTMADDGGSSGVLRDEYGVLPPGDIRRALVALSRSDKVLRDLFSYRFESGSLAGHNFGNIFLSTLEKTTGSFAMAVKKAHEVLNVQGTVVPVTLSKTRLFAELENGEIIKGETNIDIPKHDPRLKIKKVSLMPPAKSNPDAIKVIKNADLIVIGPGDLYTSIVPNLLVEGIPEAIRKSKAKKAYLVNLMTKYGETNGFDAGDFVDVIERYLGKDTLNYLIVNEKEPAEELLKFYKKKDKAIFVKPIHQGQRYILADLLAQGKFIRHDENKIARLLLGLLKTPQS
jgi:uncharacterized cofD-like protein